MSLPGTAEGSAWSLEPLASTVAVLATETTTAPSVVVLDDGQFSALAGLLLLVVFLVAVIAGAQLRRP